MTMKQVQDGGGAASMQGARGGSGLGKIVHFLRSWRTGVSPFVRHGGNVQFTVRWYLVGERAPR